VTFLFDAFNGTRYESAIYCRIFYKYTYKGYTTLSFHYTSVLFQKSRIDFLMLQYALVAKLFSHLKLFSFVYFPFIKSQKKNIVSKILLFRLYNTFLNPPIIDYPL